MVALHVQREFKMRCVINKEMRQEREGGSCVYMYERERERRGGYMEKKRHARVYTARKVVT